MKLAEHEDFAAFVTAAASEAGLPTSAPPVAEMLIVLGRG